VVKKEAQAMSSDSLLHYGQSSWTTGTFHSGQG
jgi:hypothetical protein